MQLDVQVHRKPGLNEGTEVGGREILRPSLHINFSVMILVQNRPPLLLCYREGVT